jgi:hypothetical protein
MNSSLVQVSRYHIQSKLMDFDMRPGVHSIVSKTHTRVSLSVTSSTVNLTIIIVVSCLPERRRLFGKNITVLGLSKVPRFGRSYDTDEVHKDIKLSLKHLQCPKYPVQMAFDHLVAHSLFIFNCTQGTRPTNHRLTYGARSW